MANQIAGTARQSPTVPSDDFAQQRDEPMTVFNKLADIRRLHGEIVNEHLQLESIGLDKSTGSGKAGSSRAAGRLGRRGSAAKDTKAASSAKSSQNAHNYQKSRDDGHSKANESLQAPPAEFTPSGSSTSPQDELAERKKATASIMSKLEELSSAVKRFHDVPLQGTTNEDQRTQSTAPDGESQLSMSDPTHMT